ncbi:hypothetical protein [Spirulina sp. 06S082]|uniref:hypothetical protein n=1 Tax=Spirulina sp. 06S082 TaxID=3110248 RepID=UPI002B1FD24F|nr:hypothetical protein [Spirulina sp. 06S082]MEA5469702.1 hypothetical protein [Spirulina sp. 06S082]
MTEAERIIHQFIRILNQESQNPDSAIVPEDAWQQLETLKSKLAQTDDKPKKLTLMLTKWCKENQYTRILSALRPVKSDPLADNEAPPPPDVTEQPITNSSLRSAIEDAQNKRKNRKEKK